MQEKNWFFLKKLKYINHGYFGYFLISSFFSVLKGKRASLKGFGGRVRTETVHPNFSGRYETSPFEEHFPLFCTSHCIMFNLFDLILLVAGQRTTTRSLRRRTSGDSLTSSLAPRVLERYRRGRIRMAVSSTAMAGTRPARWIRTPKSLRTPPLRPPPVSSTVQPSKMSRRRRSVTRALNSERSTIFSLSPTLRLLSNVTLFSVVSLCMLEAFLWMRNQFSSERTLAILSGSVIFNIS